jgi:hypothetical protein
LNKLFKSFNNSPQGSTKHSIYFDIYEQLFNKFINKKITLIEIGVLNGGSLFMWRKYFGKEARIIGIDLNPKAKKWEKHNFEIYIGNQEDPKFIKDTLNIIGSFDILIDDGGHTNLQQINTLSQVLKFKNKKNSIVIFEDIHCSFMTEFGNPSKFSFINYLKKINNDLVYRTYKKTNSIIKKIYSINYYESMVVLNLHKSIQKNKIVFNKNFEVNADDYRHIKFKFLKKIIKNKKIRTILKYFYYSLVNLKCKKFFNELKN